LEGVEMPFEGQEEVLRNLEIRTSFRLSEGALMTVKPLRYQFLESRTTKHFHEFPADILGQFACSHKTLENAMRFIPRSYMKLHWTLWAVDLAAYEIRHYDGKKCDVDGSYLTFLKNWLRDDRGKEFGFESEPFSRSILAPNG